MKKTYIRPATDAIRFQSEGIICTSLTSVSVDSNREIDEMFVREQLPESGNAWEW